MSNDKHRIIVTGSDDKIKEPPKVRTKDEVFNYLSERINILYQKRLACDVQLPGDVETKTTYQKRAERQYLMHLGGVLHMLGLALAMDMISENAYNEMHTLAMQTLVPTILSNTEY